VSRKFLGNDTDPYRSDYCEIFWNETPDGKICDFCIAFDEAHYKELVKTHKFHRGQTQETWLRSIWDSPEGVFAHLLSVYDFENRYELLKAIGQLGEIPGRGWARDIYSLSAAISSPNAGPFTTL